MNTKKIAIILVLVIIVLGVITLLILSPAKNNRNVQAPQSTTVSTQATTEPATVVPIKEVEFAVIRVLPSGFSPAEVTMKKGMIVRFTNPLENKVRLKWQGDIQYTSEAVYEGKDMATIVFDKTGTYVFSDDASPSNTGKVIIE